MGCLGNSRSVCVPPRERELIGIHVLELDRPALDSIITQNSRDSGIGLWQRSSCRGDRSRKKAWEVLECGLCWMELHSVGVDMAKRHSSGGVHDYIKEFCF